MMTSTREQRQQQDADTLYAMAHIYCRAHHSGADLGEHGVCAQCEDIVSYSLKRTAACPHEHKGNCKDCTIHCYKPDMRAGIKEIMRYGAPRMMYQHPVMTARYLRKKIAGKRAARASR